MCAVIEALGVTLGTGGVPLLIKTTKAIPQGIKGSSCANVKKTLNIVFGLDCAVCVPLVCIVAVYKRMTTFRLLKKH